MLRWSETPNSEPERLALLLLIPVQLERKSVGFRFHKRWTEEDIQNNPSLQVKMKQEFNLDWLEMPAEEGALVESYLASVQQTVSAMPGWSVDDRAIALGFFSFSTLLMYQALQEENLTTFNGLNQHPLLQALLDSGFKEQASTIPEGANIIS